MDFTRGSGENFGTALAQLKRTGCSILVTGQAPDDAFDAISTQLLGSSTNRTRLFALFDRDLDIVRQRLRDLPPGHSPAIVVQSTPDQPRSATTRTASMDLQTLSVRPVADDLQQVEAAVTTAVNEQTHRHGPLDAGQLRLCVDALHALDDHPIRDIEYFVDNVTTVVTDLGGIIHAIHHSDGGRNLTTAIRPVFDIIVDVRQQNGAAEHRWFIPDHQVVTPWIEI